MENKTVREKKKWTSRRSRSQIETTVLGVFFFFEVRHGHEKREIGSVYPIVRGRLSRMPTSPRSAT